jgi:cytochrome c5
MNVKKQIKLAIPVIGAIALLASMQATASDGEAVFKKTCKMCHGTGMMGAPKFGDKAAWADRIAKGIDVLHDHAINGFGKMMPKGGKKSLSDEDVKAAVDYMVDAAK